MAVSVCLVAYMASFLLLFSDFYYKAYIDNRRRRAEKGSTLEHNEDLTTKTTSNGHSAHKNGGTERNGYCHQTNGAAKKLN